MHRESLGIKFDPERRRFRSLKGFLVDSMEYDRETLDPLRIVALLERSGGRESKRRLAARLRISPGAVDDAIEKLKSTGVVTAARMQRTNDVTIQLYRRGKASGRRGVTSLGSYDTSSYRRKPLTRKPN
jgi:Mn-dependent DtxR family transcriptional regulator